MDFFLYNQVLSVWMWMYTIEMNDSCLLVDTICWEGKKFQEQGSRNSQIRKNWERTFVQISENHNYSRSAAENMFREVIKWTTHVFLGNTTLFWSFDCIS
jgi:hypothetical protein